MARGLPYTLLTVALRIKMLFSKFSSIPFEKCPVHTSVLQGDLEINAACGDPFSSPVIIPFCTLAPQHL